MTVLGAETLPTCPSGSPDRQTGQEIITVTFELPSYVRDQVDAYIMGHPGMNFRAVVLEGFRCLGIPIDDKDLTPQRATVKLRDREGKSLGQTSVRFPLYIRMAAEEYLLDHPDMRIRNLVMAGFRALGMEIKDEELVTARRNIIAAALARR